MTGRRINWEAVVPWGLWAFSAIVATVVWIYGSDADGKVALYSCPFFGLGVLTFFSGFKKYREVREFDDTPRIPIRGMPMGLVQVRGNASGDAPLQSPVWKKPCYVYTVKVERWKQDGQSGSWEYSSTKTVGLPFYLLDGTGKVLVDPEGADCDLTPYPSQVMRGLPAGLFSQSLTPGRFRVTEFLVLPGHLYDVIGSCTENPDPTDEHDRNMITKGQNDPTFAITWQTRRQKAQALLGQARIQVFGGAALSLVCAAILLGKLGLLF